jgi:branched-chain amino acid transport system ATP-binding protein
MLDDICIDKLPPHRIVESGVCMVPEGRRLFPQMTILENLEVGASVRTARRVRHKTMEFVTTDARHRQGAHE